MASTSSCSSVDVSEWDKAQELEISVNLVSAAKKELGFVAIVFNTVALRKTRILRRAVERYLNCWLPLVNKCEDDDYLVPPLDCAWIWHCHKLNPVQYGKDCMELFGRLIDMRSDEASGPGLADHLAEVTVRRWEESYPNEPFAFIQAGADHGIRTYCQSDLSLLRDGSSPLVLAFDLIAAAKRQESFYYQVCHQWMSDRKYLQEALKRYKGFLYLMKRAVEIGGREGVPFLVPTYDIDLLWHSHQLCPTAYRVDTVKMMGIILNHDDTDSDRGAGQRLQKGFLDTCTRWKETFGFVYERAGAMYRGAEPTPVPPLPLEDPNQVVTGFPVTASPEATDAEPQFAIDNAGLTRRETMKVHLVIFGARNIPQKPGMKTYSCVRVTALRKCPGMALLTLPTECTSSSNNSEKDLVMLTEGVWNQGFSMQVEVSTEGLKLELMQYSRTKDGGGNKGLMGKMKRTIESFTSKANCVGYVVVNWRTDLLDLQSSQGLSFSKVSPLVVIQTKKMKSQLQDPNATVIPVPELHFSVSVTPPSGAPHIFRLLQAPVTDDAALQVARKVPYSGEKRQEGRWITRVVTDHQGQEQFVVRTRFATGVLSMFECPRRTRGDQKLIYVHHGPLTRQREWLYQGQFLVRTTGLVGGVARQLPVAVEQGHSTRHRHWSLLNDAAVLRVNKPERKNTVLECHIQGNLGYPFRLLPGRRLEYEVRGGSEGGGPTTTLDDEYKFQTFVRYTPQNRRGKATALINWQDASIEVQPEESVVLILLITSAINSSLVDMRHPDLERFSTFHGQEMAIQSRIARGNRHPEYDGDLGAMLIERNRLSSMWKGPAAEDQVHENNEIFRTNWWNLTDTQILTGGAQFGGTQCGSGACGAGACGGGGCSSGVGGSFYFQSPDTF